MWQICKGVKHFFSMNGYYIMEGKAKKEYIQNVHDHQAINIRRLGTGENDF